MAGPIRSDELVTLEMNAHQASILSYIVRRAQEDPHFFDQLVGEADHKVTNRLRITVAHLVKKLDALVGR